MYAVIASGGKQYKVSIGEEIFIEKLLDVDAGDKVVFDDVLAIGDDKGLNVGLKVKSAKVSGEVVKQGRGKKIIVFKYKPKQGYRRKKGHRQPYTRVRITAIDLAGTSTVAPAAKPKVATEEKPKTVATEKPKATTVAKPKTAIEAKPKTTTVAKPKTTTAAKPKATTEAKPKATTAAKPKATTAAKPKTTTAAKPKTTTAAKPKAKSDETKA